jgi:hypothetical protein
MMNKVKRSYEVRISFRLSSSYYFLFFLKLMVYKYHQLVYKENTIFAAAKDRTPDQQPTPAQSASAN